MFRTDEALLLNRGEILVLEERISSAKFRGNETYFDRTHGDFEMHLKFVLLNEKDELTYDENNSHRHIN